METLYYCTALLLFALFIFIHFFHHNPKLPPSPRSIPMIGHLHLIKNWLPQALNSLSIQYGPIFSLQFGCRPMVVVSSPSIVEECFTKHDIIFANRPRSMAGDRFTFNYTAFVWAPYGHLWRCLRRLTVVELFSSHSLQKSSVTREEETRTLLRQLYVVTKNGGQKVELNFWFSILSFNILTRIVSGKQWIREEDMCMETSKKCLEDMKGLFFASIATNVCDFFPVLRWVGYKGIEKRMMGLQEKRNEFLEGLIDEFRVKKTSSSIGNGGEKMKKSTLIETLLALQESEPDFYSDDVIKSIILIVFVAGTETTSVTLEWAMSLLLGHPEALQKASAEIDKNVGHRHLLTELDLPNLPYLRCIVNEALRLYPPVPLLLPHYSSEDCTVGGYKIPKNTTLMVNAWAMQRDPKEWEEPNKFKPERFEGEKEGFKFVPFGIGRRACPGANMGMRTVLLALGALIQCFEWERIGQDEIDMSHGSGVLLRKAKPLEAACTPRQNAIQLLSLL